MVFGEILGREEVKKIQTFSSEFVKNLTSHQIFFFKRDKISPKSFFNGNKALLGNEIVKPTSEASCYRVVSGESDDGAVVGEVVPLPHVVGDGAEGR
jgi:hypothetical protein